MKNYPERDKPAPLPAQLPVFEYRGKPVADSRNVAAMIGRPHWQILRTISTFCKHLNDNKIVVADYFTEHTYIDEKGESRPCYYLTEMGCDMVANKQTGEAGTVFTARYVKAFHQMRALLLERSSPIWQDTRSLGKEIRRIETDAIKQFVGYAKAQGSQNAERYYTNLSRLADRTAGIEDRDKAQVVQLTSLLLVEKVVAREIAQGIEAGTHYKAIYQAIKDKLAAFGAVAALGEG